MARITFSPLVASASGKAADAVFASWKGIAYVRQLVIPKNPNSAAQQVVRASMGRIPPLWRSLAAKVKAVQNTYASSYNMSGYNWFGKQNRVLEQDHKAQHVCPPSIVNDRVASLALSDQTGGVIKVDWTGGSVGADKYIYVLARDRTTGSEVDKFTIESDGVVLVSANTVNITMAANHSYEVVVAVEDTTTSLFSQSQADDIALGA